jgi:hypothetical protein
MTLRVRMASINDLLTEYRASSGPSTIEQIESAEAALGTPIPSDLSEFLLSRGPGEGFVGAGGYLRIAPPEDWPSKHTMLEASITWPGLLIFGSDGAGGFFAFDKDTQLYVEVDAIGDSDRRALGRSFVEFVTSLAERRDGDS